MHSLPNIGMSSKYKALSRKSTAVLCLRENDPQILLHKVLPFLSDAALILS